MIIQTWFPLAVASVDLEPSPTTRTEMLAALGPWIAAAQAQRRLDFAWTGDVNGCVDLHNQVPFAWLRGGVERQARAFLSALGCDLPRLSPHFLGSWPVLSSGQESVASHTHAGASLSAVYYLQVPEGPGGTLVFENVGNPNSLGAEFGEAGTPTTRASNPYNLQETCYEPREGRLLLFSARQPHAVRAHGGESLRISITFDIGLGAPPPAGARPAAAPPEGDRFAPQA